MPVNTLRERQTFPPTRLAWMVWGLGAALYLIGFYHRVAPAVMTNELMQEFKLSGAALGNLSAFYFYNYVAIQIPTGILADYWGSRRLLTTGALIAGCGSLIFGLADNMLLAGLGRLMIGGAVAVAFVSMMKLSSHWMKPRHFALASGMALFFGIMGGLAAGVPLRLAITTFGWRHTMQVSSLFALILGVLIWFLVRDDPQEKGYSSYAPETHQGAARIGIFTGLRQVLSYKNSWLLFLIPGSLVGSVLTFAGLWGVPFLTTHYDLSSTQAAAITSAMLFAWAIGGPVFGYFSDHIGRRKPLYLAGCLTSTLCWSLVVFVPGLPLTFLILLLVCAGFSAGSMIIGFAFSKESVPSQLSGTASGVCNMGSMIGPMVLQPAVGLVLDINWTGKVIDGNRVYDLAAYQFGFSLMLAWLVLSTVLLLFSRETCCQQS